MQQLSVKKKSIMVHSFLLRQIRKTEQDAEMMGSQDFIGHRGLLGH